MLLASVPDGQSLAFRVFTQADSFTYTTSTITYTIQLFAVDLASKQKRLLFQFDENAKGSLSPNWQYISVCEPNGTVRVLELATGRTILTINGENMKLHNETFSADSRFYVVTHHTPDGQPYHQFITRVWHLETGSQLCEYLPNDFYIPSTLSPDGNTLLMVDLAGEPPRILDVRSGNIRAVLPHRASLGNFRPVFTRDSILFAAPTSDHSGQVHLWKTQTGEHLATLQGHQGDVNCLAFNRDDTLLATGGDDGTIRLWSIDGIL